MTVMGRSVLEENCMTLIVFSVFFSKRNLLGSIILFGRVTSQVGKGWGTIFSGKKAHSLVLIYLTLVITNSF